MKKKMETFCQICLRADRNLKVVDECLTNFHKELCVYPLITPNPQFCHECEHLLRKLYNFKAQCMNANEILRNWKKMTKSEFIDSILLNEDIKLEGGCKTDLTDLLLDDLNTLKNENSTGIFVEVPTLEGNLKNAEDSGGGTKQNDDIENENDLDNKSVTINHCYFNGEAFKHNESKKSNLPLDDDDPIFNDSVEEKETENDLESDTNKSLKRKKIVDKGDTKKKRSITKKVDRGKDKICLTKKNTKSVESKNCEKDRFNRMPFSKERLKERLQSIFESCGDIKTEDGTVIDKKFIMSSLDNKVTETVMRLLWKALQIKNGKQNFRPRAFKIFKSIQKTYKDDAQYETVFHIEYLTTEEEMVQEFRNRKSYECYINAEYKCEICYQGFKYKKSLEYHQKSHDVTGGDTCSICGVGQRDKGRLKLHIHKVHGAVYKCRLCPLVTYYRQSMINHYHQHNGVQYKCEPCGMTFNSRSVHLNHQTSRHSSARHACVACGRAFVSELGLREHTTRKHKGAAPTNCEYKCELCELAFPTESVYLRHVRGTHERRAAPGAEPHLYRPRTTLASLRNRVRTPRKEIVMTCRVCKASGNYYGWLYLHFRMKHPTVDMALVYSDRQKHLCHVCGKGFSSAAMLRNHLNTHTDVRPFACDACPKRFNSNYSLYSHRLLHLPPGKSCPHCFKKFHTQSNLTNHMRTHIGNRRYKCSICGKGFLHRHSLNEHVRGVHNHVSRAKKRRANESGANQTDVKKMASHIEESSE